MLPDAHFCWRVPLLAWNHLAAENITEKTLPEGALEATAHPISSCLAKAVKLVALYW